MISVAQVRAARALLGWKQNELAAKAGLSLTAINNLERGIGSPRLETMTMIQAALENAGLLFLEDDGVKKRGEFLEIIRHEGQNFIKGLTDDMLKCLHEKDDEVLMCGIDERRFEEFDEGQLVRYATAAGERKFKERILAGEGDKYFVSKPSCYRWISEDAFGKIPYLVYGDRVAFLFWEAPQRCVIIRNPSFVGMFRVQFEFLWRHAKIHGITKSLWTKMT